MDVEEVLNAIAEMRQDEDVPKGVKAKLESISEELKGVKEISLSVNKILSDLEEVMNDANIDPMVRTQLFNLATLLEGLVS